MLQNKELTQLLIKQKSLIALLMLIAIISLFSEQFFSTSNLLQILRQTSINAILAVGMTLVILTSGIDLSVGSVLALCGAFAASMSAAQVPIFLLIPITLISGLLLGGLSGFIIAKGRIQPFIATLVMMSLLRGVTMLYTNGHPISTGSGSVSELFSWFGTGYLFSLPVPVWLMSIAFISIWYLLNHMRFGRYVYALGGNEAATRLSGINVDRIKIGVYALSGLFAALAAIISTSRLSSAQPTAGVSYELDAIAAVVVGGTSLTGGVGRITGTLIGALIIGVLNNALNLLDVSSYYQTIAKALVILLAVLVDNKSR